MFVARIHNNSLGICIEVDTYQDGVEIILQWATDQGLTLDDDDLIALENELEYTNDDDESNIFTFSFGELQPKE